MEARDHIAAPRYAGQPVKCYECGKPFSDTRLKHHLQQAHNIS